MSLLSDNINRDYETLNNDSTQQVIITLDENYSSSLLKMKLYTTSYLITLLSSEEFDKAFLSEIRNKLDDQTIKSAINRISGKYFKSLENQEYQKYESLFKIMNDIKKESELEQFINTLPIKFHNNVNFLLQHKSTLKYYSQMTIETALQLFEKFSIDNFPDHIKNDKQRIMYDIKNGELKYNQIRELAREDKDVAKAILMKISKQNDIIQLLDGHSYDLDLVLLAVTRTRDIIRFLPNQVKTRQVVKAAIEHSPESIEYLSDEYLCDREILLIALKSNPFLNVFKFCKDVSIFHDREFMIQASQFNGTVYNYALLSDREFVKNIIKNNPKILFTTFFTKDVELIKIAFLGNHYNYIEFIEKLPISVFENSEIVEIALTFHPKVYKIASINVQKNPRIVFKAIMQDIELLNEIPKELSFDYELMTSLLDSPKNEAIVKFAADEFYSNFGFMMKAITKNRVNYKYASNELKSDLKFIEKLSELDAILVNKDFKSEYLNEKKIMMNLLHDFPEKFVLLPTELQNDLEICKIVAKFPNILEKFPSNIKFNKEILLIALQSSFNIDLYFQASLELQRDRDVILCYLNNFNCKNIDIVIENYPNWENDMEIARKIIRIEPEIISLYEEFLYDEENLLRALKKKIELFQELPKEVIDKFPYLPWKCCNNAKFEELIKLLEFGIANYLSENQIKKLFLKYPKIAKNTKNRKLAKIAVLNQNNLFSKLSDELKSDEFFLLELSVQGKKTLQTCIENEISKIIFEKFNIISNYSKNERFKRLWNVYVSRNCKHFEYFENLIKYSFNF